MNARAAMSPAMRGRSRPRRFHRANMSVRADRGPPPALRGGVDGVFVNSPVENEGGHHRRRGELPHALQGERRGHLHRDERPGRPGELSAEHEEPHALAYPGARRRGHHRRPRHVNSRDAQPGREQQDRQHPVAGRQPHQAHETAGHSGRQRHDELRVPAPIAEGAQQRVEEGRHLSEDREGPRLEEREVQLDDDERPAAAPGTR